MEISFITVFFTSTSFLIATLVVLFYVYLKYVVYNVWDPKEVPHEAPSIPLGNVPISYLKGEVVHGTIIKESYMKFKKSRFFGLYMLCEPVLIINDPELIQLVLVKNFSEFYNRGIFIDEHKDVLSTSISRMKDGKWKRLREKLSPIFTSGKLKLMYPLIEDICRQLIRAVDEALIECNEIEFKEFTTRFTVDCISSIAYGFNADSLHDSYGCFLKFAKSSNYVGRFIILCSFFVPQLIRFTPVPAKRKHNEQFFIDLFTDMLERRRKENTVRNDFLNMLMRLVDHGKIDENSKVENEDQPYKVTESDKLTMKEAVGQSFIFFAAGHDTVSSLITCCLYELARNPDVQEELYYEICEVQKSSGGLTYDKLFDMQYLGMVIQESLRKYPVSSVLNRICGSDFSIPDSNVTIKKGTRIVIPISGLHADPDIYPEPDKFDPTRFAPENKAKLNNFTYLPFGDGPKQCIGKRLGMLKSKIALFYLLWNYEFSSCEKTPGSIEFLADYFTQCPCDVTLKIEKRIRI